MNIPFEIIFTLHKRQTMIDSSILHIIIFHRQLGTSDESSTDEEQGERILYFYPQETSLYWQVRCLHNFASDIKGLMLAIKNDHGRGFNRIHQYVF